MSSSLILMVIFFMTAGLQRSESKVNYRCVYGPLRFTIDDEGIQHQYCFTRMTPPFLRRGAYTMARDRNNACFECLCDEGIGLACCEKRCQ